MARLCHLCHLEITVILEYCMGFSEIRARELENAKAAFSTLGTANCQLPSGQFLSRTSFSKDISVI
jgi:hypothetical protein